MLRSQIQSSVDVKRLTEAERIVSESDLTQLKAYLSLPTVTPQQRAMVESLEATALLVEPEQIPPDVVTMNTTIECTVVGSAKTYHWTLVYPDKAEYLLGRLSVLSPAGISLLGARCGQTVVCRPPSGVQIFYLVNAILLQPESRHLAL
ncbi:regulator of nucleoside diphosphate kinase [Trinickia symbiotica]|uniref:Nucleoside diphosphate kinase regulator n=1 Tax=Trinickia symbiotica TaxID=863227 RepID=A0A2N7WQP0_9BURK|nr:GreA/GreB family elongation factor [Trinickia symbiotica]PMS31635.1 nucleoside diphosphate kinase regulator [Trinickia symbiotica]PPK41265.1 regulator of nucleoside diphosphate kinase [Trinickia symbiotica]